MRAKIGALNYVGWLRRLKLSGWVAFYPFVLLVLLTVATSAKAATFGFNLNFSGTGISGALTATATFGLDITTECPSSCSGTVESLTGTLNGFDVTLLPPYPETGSYYGNDNFLFYSGSTGSAFPDGNGISFSAGGVDYNLYVGSIHLCSGTVPTCTTLTSYSGTLAPSVVPLPTALPLFATGLGALGLLGWRRKRKALAA